MKRIALSGGKAYALVSDEDYGTLSAHTWCVIIGPYTHYAKTKIDGKTIRMHRMIMGLLDAPKSVFVDHINGNGLHNYRTNLRISDPLNNQHNRRKHTKTRSKYKGVTKTHNQTNPWQARITVSGTLIRLGYYRTEENAARAYNSAAIEHFGEHANLNIIGLDKS